MKTRIIMVCLVTVLMVGCQINSPSPYPGGTGSPMTTVGGELQPLPFADELQKILDDGLKASNGAGISAAVIWEWLAILSSIVWMLAQSVLLGSDDLKQSS